MSTHEVVRRISGDERHAMDVRVGAKVRGRMAEQSVTQAEIALVLGLRQQSVSKRLHGIVPFEYSELWEIARRLGWSGVSTMLAEVETPPHGGGSGSMVLPRLDSNQKPAGNWPRVKDSIAKVIILPSRPEPLPVMEKISA